MKYLLLLGLVSLTSLSTYAQISPSPNASSQAKFASTPVNEHTGVPSIHAPLLTLPGRHTSVPIGLSYHAGGFKVQEIAGPVGLGFALSAGGVITRTVRGLPDDAKYGYGGTHQTGIEPLEISSNVNQRIGNYSTQFLTQVGTLEADGEPDMFYFNVMGRVGRFVLDANGNALLMPYQDIAIQVTKQDENGQFVAWSITTEDGTAYRFGTEESAREESRAQSLLSDEVQSTQTFISSWYLTEISSPQTKERIDFSYQSGNEVTYEYRNYREQRAVEGNCGDDAVTRDRLTTRVTLRPPRRLARIKSALGSVTFAYEHERTDLPGQYALSQVTLNDYDGRQKQRIRLHYGMFDSHERVQSLKRASYNSQKQDYRRLRLDRIEDVTDGTQLLYHFAYQDDEKHFLWDRHSSFYDHWGYATAAPIAYDRFDYRNYIPTVTIDGTTYSGVNRSATSSYGQAYLLTRMTNALGGYTVYDYEAHHVGSNPSDRIGGARIKSIRSFDGQGTAPVHETTYNYHGSGQALAEPTYGYILDFQEATCELLVRYAQSLVNLFDLNGAAIGYSKVSARQSDGSYTTHYFTNFGDYDDEETSVYRYYSRNDRAWTSLKLSLACNPRSANIC